MTSRDFCYWLQGFFELNASEQGDRAPESSLTPAQVTKVRSHLAMVFKTEIDPSFCPVIGPDLSALHGPGHGGDVLLRC